MTERRPTSWGRGTWTWAWLETWTVTANRSWRIFNQQLSEVTDPRRTKSGVEVAWQRLIDGKAATNLAAVDFRERNMLGVGR